MAVSWAKLYTETTLTPYVEFQECVESLTSKTVGLRQPHAYPTSRYTLGLASLNQRSQAMEFSNALFDPIHDVTRKGRHIRSLAQEACGINGTLNAVVENVFHFGGKRHSDEDAWFAC